TIALPPSTTNPCRFVTSIAMLLHCGFFTDSILRDWIARMPCPSGEMPHPGRRAAIHLTLSQSLLRLRPSYLLHPPPRLHHRHSPRSTAVPAPVAQPPPSPPSPATNPSAPPTPPGPSGARARSASRSVK